MKAREPSGSALRWVIPSIQDNDIDRVSQLSQAHPGAATQVVLDMKNCQWLGQNATAALGGLVRRLHMAGVEVFTDFGGSPHPVENHLRRNGFLRAFGQEPLPETGHAVPFRRDARFDKDALTEYLLQHWIGSGWLDVSEALSRAIAGTVCEIYINAFEHSNSQVGVCSCGQHYPRSNRLRLSVVDFGIGVVESVRSFARNPSIRADRALQWAFADGSSTAQSNTMRRGLGLGLLRDLVQVNGGSLKLYSNEGGVLIGDGEERYALRDVAFHGTLVMIDLVCDERYYALRNEPSPALRGGSL